jgi:hypothetical protein
MGLYGIDQFQVNLIDYYLPLEYSQQHYKINCLRNDYLFHEEQRLGIDVDNLEECRKLERYEEYLKELRSSVFPDLAK